VELKGRSLPFCHGCAYQVLRLAEVPDNIEELREALKRDRRENDRREGKADQRIFPRERRVGERRGPVRDAFADTDPKIRLPDYEDVIIELDEIEMEPVEQTSVRGRPAATLPPEIPAEARAASAAAATAPTGEPPAT
jgi:hypothetical protein